MKVKELIELLEKMPQDDTVVLSIDNECENDFAKSVERDKYFYWDKGVKKIGTGTIIFNY